jgi:hypothetical protein
MKGIQILIFIPAFILAIFLYSFIKLYNIKKNFSFHLYNDKNGNQLKVFLKNWKTYNCIIANKSSNGSIDFLVPKKGLVYELDPEKNYNLIIYVFWSFDVFRTIFSIWNIHLNWDKSSYEFYLSEKYDEDKDISKIDTLKTTLSQEPYVKEKQTLYYNQNRGLDFKIISNEKLKILWEEDLSFLHFLLILLWSIWIIIEWQNQLFTMILWWTILFVFLLRKKRWKLNNIFKNILLISAFALMIGLTAMNRDMSGPGSIFLIQILLIVYLFPKEFKNSFLYIFLLLFVFVAISLFSNQIRFIILFLLNIFISIYLLFFISGTESFEDRKYRIGTVVNFAWLLKTSWIIIWLMFVFFFILPHGNAIEDRTTFANVQNEWKVTGFNDEINLENIANIREDTRKVIVIENVNQTDINNLWIEYFRWKRFNIFDGKKWYDNFPRKASYLTQKQQDKNIQLNIKYFLNWGKSLFLPASPLSIEDTIIPFGSMYSDFTTLWTLYGINEPISLNVTFNIWKNNQIIDRWDENLEVSSRVNKKVKETFQEYFDSIPVEYTTSPELLTQYIRDLSGFEYSMSDVSSDISDFLYDKQKGHCEYFASTLVIALQYFWYNPTLVTWFAWWEYNELAQSYIIRAKNAHTWVELYDQESQTWKRYDPTPAARSIDQIWTIPAYQFIVDIYDYIDIKWYTYIVNYTWDQQQKIYKYIYNNKTSILFILIYILLLIAIFIYIKKIVIFFNLTPKEKKLFILSKYYNHGNNIIEYISDKDKTFAKKLEQYAYGNIWHISYKNLFQFIKENKKRK